jgi:hypothetical protein
MLRIRVSELSLPDRNRLHTDLAMTMLSDFTYPPFVDYQSGELRMRPFGQADRQRAEQFVAGLRLEQLETVEITSAALAEQLAEVLVSYQRAVLPNRAQRHGAELQRQALQLATQVQRRLVDYVLNSANNGFGLTVAPGSWRAGHSTVQPWEAIAPGTVSLASALATLREEAAPAAAPPRTPSPPSSPAPPTPPGKPALPEMATTLLPAVGRTASQPMTPPADPPRPPEAMLTAPLPRAVESPKTPVEQRSDQATFMQLREQLLSAMTNAARNYGITRPPADPAGLLAALRQRNAIDESDLRLAEGILALCGRVVTAGRAGIDEYREALMLYLLFHRSRFARR